MTSYVTKQLCGVLLMVVVVVIVVVVVLVVVVVVVVAGFDNFEEPTSLINCLTRYSIYVCACYCSLPLI